METATRDRRPFRVLEVANAVSTPRAVPRQRLSISGSRHDPFVLGGCCRLFPLVLWRAGGGVVLAPSVPERLQRSELCTVDPNYNIT